MKRTKLNKEVKRLIRELMKRKSQREKNLELNEKCMTIKYD